MNLDQRKIRFLKPKIASLWRKETTYKAGRRFVDLEFLKSRKGEKKIMLEKFEINQSSLEKARNTHDNNWLELTFNKAREVIEAGGKVNVTQQFSDASTELVAIIDTKELLTYYKKKYLNEE